MAEVLSSEELADETSDYGSLRPGTRLGRYELLVPIARGGMARVWAARQHGQRGFQKLVAIKTILPHLSEEPEFERMFLDEARIASGCHHPNVCEIYELGEDGRTLYLAMEWASGDALSRVLRPTGGKTEALDPRIAARIVADACGGAHAAHELVDDDGRHLGVVHRDLSPHNILLTVDGVAKVCDFGVAKALNQLHEQTSAGQIKGKLSYMAPEQVMGSGVDRRSDVFSLGCVLYEATTGVRPFRGDGDLQVMQAILQSEVAPPTSVVRHYPVELERIVLRAIAHEPALRFPTAERMRFALEEYLARGQLITQSNVAHAIRARIGDQIDRRKELIKQASSVAEQSSWDPANAAPTRDPQDHRSGVKPLRGPPTGQMPAVTGQTPSGGVAYANQQSRPPMASSPAISRTPPSHPAYEMPGGMPPDGMTRRFGAGGTLPPPAPAGFSRPPSRDWSSPGHVPMPIGAPDAPGSQPYAFRQSPDQAPVPDAPVSGAGHYAAAALVGLLCALLIGGGGFVFWRTRANANGPAAAATMTASARGAPSAPPTGSAAVAAATPANPATQAVSADLVIRVTPPDATVVVDGRELPPGVRTMPRPATGKTVAVAARAKGRDEATVFVDYYSANPVEITLKPILELDSPPSTTPSSTVASPSNQTPTATPTTKSGPKRAPAALPDNPY